MAERPILVSDAMVRAILAGTKTQTRRVIAGARGAFWDHRSYTGTVERDGVLRFRVGPDGEIANGSPEVRCPHGAVGDRLWVREAWTMPASAHSVYYRADYPSGNRSLIPREPDYDSINEWAARYRVDGWHPSIHMPRWASRLALEITSVRVERVQSISEDDARAEGVAPFGNVHPAQPIPGVYGLRTFGAFPHVGAFASLWDSINSEREGCSWGANPWVWAIAFRRVSP